MIPTNPHPCPSPALLAARIAAERHRLGLTQRGAAAVLDISQSSFRDYESGRCRPSVETLHALAFDLGMDLRAILPEWFAADGPSRHP